MSLVLRGICLMACLKTLDTIGSCQRPVLSLGVSQLMHKSTNLGNFELDWSSELRNNYERKNTLVTWSCVLSDAWFRDLKIMHKITNLWKFELNWLSKLRDNNGKKMLDFGTSESNSEVLNSNYGSGKLLLSRKLPYFRGSRFSHCFILLTALHYSLTSKVLC